MRAISLFSGAGGFEIGLQRAGVRTVLQAEQDPWCLSVLERHWPDVERVTDVRQVDATALQRRRRDVDGNGARTNDQRLGRTARGAAGIDRGADGFQPTSHDVEQGRVGRELQARHDPRFTYSESGAEGATVDLVYGGFPCQDVSVAGKRAGLSGERSGLWHEFYRVLSELRPRWFVIENVPGLLSSNRGRDFATILLGVENLGYGWAYRVLDARWFGVPQRRRRVFVVGCLGDAASAAQVLAVCESCGGHPAPRGKAGQDIAPTLDDGARRASVELPMIAAARPLTARSTGYRMDYETENFLVEDDLESPSGPVSIAADAVGLDTYLTPVNDYPLSDKSSPVRPQIDPIVANALRASDGHHGHSSPRGDGADNLIAFSSKDYGADAQNQRSPTLKVGGAGEGGGNPPAIVYAQGVRRLTPLECERLMGWPDEWTRYTADDREIPDSHRYRMCGNGVVSTVAEWIGHRLMWVERSAAR